jgi:rod shape-determining protein MreC
VPERSYTRRDTMMLLACLGISALLLVLPNRWSQAVGAGLRQSVLAPFVWLQTRAQEGKTSRARLQAAVAQRDSLAVAVQFLPALRAENEQLRLLLRLTQVTDGRALLLSVGTDDGVAAFDPVVAPEGLIGMVLDASRSSSIAMTWAHPEFRVSAFATGGTASGMVAPSADGSGVLEFRDVPYRDSIAAGTLVLSSGLGGVYPKGIPVGTVTGILREQAGWGRAYRLRPAADPASTPHVLVLTASDRGDVADAFAADSAPIPTDSAHGGGTARGEAGAHDSTVRAPGAAVPAGRAPTVPSSAAHPPVLQPKRDTREKRDTAPQRNAAPKIAAPRDTSKAKR